MAEEKGYKIKSLEWQYKPPHNQIEYVDIENYSAKTPFGKISVYRARNSGEKKWNNWFIWLPQKQEVELLSGTTPKQAGS